MKIFTLVWLIFLIGEVILSMLIHGKIRRNTSKQITLNIYIYSALCVFSGSIIYLICLFELKQQFILFQFLALLYLACWIAFWIIRINIKHVKIGVYKLKNTFFICFILVLVFTSIVYSPKSETFIKDLKTTSVRKLNYDTKVFALDSITAYANESEDPYIEECTYYNIYENIWGYETVKYETRTLVD